MDATAPTTSLWTDLETTINAFAISAGGLFNIPTLSGGIPGNVINEYTSGVPNPVIDTVVRTEQVSSGIYTAAINSIPSSTTVTEYAIGAAVLLVLVLLVLGKIEAL